jgi:hypothetical protein
VPEEYGDWWTCNSDRAQALGLTYRPATEIGRDILEWDATRPPDEERMAGLSPEEEKEVLAKWHAQASRRAGKICRIEEKEASLSKRDDER